jgi:probable HAF family extracellular repeat protein
LADWVFDLGTLPGGEHSIALDVNRWGQTVGTSTSDQGLSHAVLWDNFQAIDLNLYLGADERLAGWHLGSATSINDGGAILVNGFNLITHEGQAFLLTPVPEPGTWALWLAGLAGVALAKARRVGTRSVL